MYKVHSWMISGGNNHVKYQEKHIGLAYKRALICLKTLFPFIYVVFLMSVWIEICNFADSSCPSKYQ